MWPLARKYWHDLKLGQMKIANLSCTLPHLVYNATVVHGVNSCHQMKVYLNIRLQAKKRKSQTDRSANTA